MTTNNRKKVVLLGSSGMVGGAILLQLLGNDDVGIVTSIVRNPSFIAHPKLREVVHHDFSDFSAIQQTLADVDVCFFCVGVYTGQVPTPEFRRITVDVPKALAEAVRSNSTDCVFVFLSGQGADTSEQSAVMFARDKGAAENILLGLNFTRLHIFRPGYIYPIKRRREPNFFYAFMRILYKPFVRWAFASMSVTSEELVTAMISAGLRGCHLTTLENNDIRNLSRVSSIG